MLLNIWLVSSMACVYPLFRGIMEVKAMAALEDPHQRERERERESITFEAIIVTTIRI